MQELPRSQATTVLELLEDVKRDILAEPRRANMTTYCRSNQPNHGRKLFIPVPEETPACQTVGCFAGWVALEYGLTPYYAEALTAKLILGLDLQYDFRIAGRYHLYSFFDDANMDPDFRGLHTGTPAYARAVVRRINRFIEFNREALAGRPLPPREAFSLLMQEHYLPELLDRFRIPIFRDDAR